MNRKQLLKYLCDTLPQTSTAVLNAVVSILIDGSTWRSAAIANGVTESGILKAMQRSKVKEFLAGQSTILTDS